MNILPKPVSRLIESFEKLPGVGPKTAQRLAFYLLHVPDRDLENFAHNLTSLKSETVLCEICKNVAEMSPCSLCSDTGRDKSIICVVEQPMDVISIEKTNKFSGLYHVLHGSIDPLNNIGPDEIYIDTLISRIKHSLAVREVIFALNPNMIGEATALYIQKKIRENDVHAKENAITITRLAHGLPMGGDIEYADEITLGRALDGRKGL
ncbi:recombination protein RecR [Candidatus Gottesmanbacteria bacterium]|nr:recombination protein RecR [Candidatus Gottesmanbacteria bacterium]